MVLSGEDYYKALIEKQSAKGGGTVCISNAGDEVVNASLRSMVRDVMKERKDEKMEKICVCCDEVCQCGKITPESIIAANTDTNSDSYDQKSEQPPSVDRKFEQAYVGTVEICHEIP